MFADKTSVPDKVKRQTLFRLWLHLVRRGQAITTAEMSSAFRDAKSKLSLQLYEQYVDEHGKTTLNIKQYMKFRKEQNEFVRIKPKRVSKKDKKDAGKIETKN